MKTPDKADHGSPSDFDPELDPLPAGEAEASRKARLEAALMAAGEAVKPGEDPFEYDLTEGAGVEPAPSSEAQVYVASAEAAKRRRRDTLELVDKVEVAPGVDPRRAVTQRVQVPAAVPEQVAATEQRSSHPPPVTPPASGGPGSEQRARRRAGWWVVVTAVAVLGVGAVMFRLGPAQVEGASQAEAAGAVVGAPSSSSIEERSAPSATTPAPAATVREAPSTSKQRGLPALPMRIAPASADDPYQDAAVPRPVRTAAPSAQPEPSPPPSTSAIVLPAQPAPRASASSHLFSPVPPY